jgi:acyl transferase domain-containing protein
VAREELTTEKRALLALRRLRSRLAEMERASREPIAIIGLGCRLPGAVDQDAFWALLREGRDAVEEIPSERWDVDAFYDPNPDVPGKMYTRRGGFLREVDRFDAAFFGISPREAMSMDPQQRLFLEVAWEALENAGQAPENLAGTQTGVFMGISSNDYFRLAGTGDSSRLDAHGATGNAFCVTPNRFSYLLGLEGPSIAVDTACSSSLVAVHLACQSLRNGESDLALAGGVNLVLSPENSIIFSRSRMLSPDGRCKTFDAAADGYVRGEGCGVVVLRRLSDAQARGERVLAVIRGSAVNQDGRSPGLTAPNERAQELVIRKALESAGVSPEEVDYVEAHGTGTALGDPIEVQALGAVLCRDRGVEHPLVIGSVKTNFGHLESAAGVAGLIKVVLSLGHGEIAPHLHFHEPSPHIAWSELPLLVPTSPLPWPAVEGRRRIAGVSSFGFGGTNAHVIVEEAPVAGESAGGGPERPLHLLALSARSEEALRQLAARYEAYLREADAGSFADACFTAGVGRSHFRHRLAVLAGGAEEARVRLASFLAGEEPAGVVAGQGGVDGLKVAFLFSGQGTAYAGMGRRLYETQPGFRRALERCADLLRPHLDRPLLEVLYGGGGELEETLYAQPALFSLQYALADLWRSWGIEPVAVLGHSVGEYAAACVAGVFSLEEGLRLIAARGRLLQATPRGAMASVQAAAPWVEERLAGLEDRVSIAALNGADSVVISGEVAAVEWLLEQWSREGVKVKRLAVSRGFHSPLLDPVLESFAREAAGVSSQAPRLALVSNVTGELWPAGEVPEAGYWAEHARRAVRFASGVETLRRQGVEAWVEVGPSPVLLGLAGRLLPDGLLVASLREGRDDWEQMLESLGRLYAHGAAVDWAGFDRDHPRRRVALPTSPFQRERYWLDLPAAGAVEAPELAAGPPLKGLLGGRLRSPRLQEAVFESRFSAARLPLLAQHQVYGRVVVPAAGHLSLILSAASQALGAGPCTVEDLAFAQALVLPSEGWRTVQIALAPQEETGETPLEIHSLAASGEQWVCHATGRLRAGVGVSAAAAEPLSAVQGRCGEELPGSALYQRMRENDIDLGPGFAWIEQVWRGDGEALGRLRVALPQDELETYSIHPGLLDSCFQLLALAFPSERLAEGAHVPVGVASFRWYRPGAAAVWCQARARAEESAGAATLAGDVRLLDAAGELVAEVAGLYVRRAPREVLLAATEESEEGLVGVEWRLQPLAAAAAGELAGTWLLLGEPGAWMERLAAQLEAGGGTCVRVFAGKEYRELGERCFTVDPQSREGFERLLEQTRGLALAGVLHLWGAGEAVLPAESALAELKSAQERICGSALHLLQALAMAPVSSPPRLLLVTRGAQPVGPPAPLALGAAALWGLGRTIAREHPELRCTLVDLDPAASAEEVAPLVAELGAPGEEDQVAFRGGRRYVARLVPRGAEPPAAEPLRLEVSQRGVLENLQLRPMARRPPGPGEVEIRVLATGLNFRDVLNALGMYPGEAGPLGGECAGSIAAVGEGVDLEMGSEVIAALAPASFAHYVTVDAGLVVPKPANLSFEEAASVPLVFLTALYGLRELARLKPGERVLIHAAAGGVGLAAVQIARRCGAEIFATAGSAEKREYLKSLGIEHVLSSRSLEFAEEVLARTGGRGVDVVLNSLAGDFVARSLSVLAPGGRFVEIGKAGLLSPEQVAALQPGIRYLAFDLAEVAREDSGRVRSLLCELVEDLARGALRPLPCRLFPLEQAATAFRYMAQARQIGKVVLAQGHRLDPERPLRAEGTYLITGGLGALGLQVARWMVERGARHLVLMGRRGASAEARREIGELERIGAQVRVVRADVSQAAELAAALAGIESSMPPLRGIVHAAGVLDDGVLVQQSWDRVARVLAPKLDGAWNLHALTRQAPLELFVLFSSAASLLGAAGQGNYAAANTFLDALAHHRQAHGLPALSINWGPWDHRGMVATLAQRDLNRWKNQGIESIQPSEGVRLLERMVKGTAPQAGVLLIDWERFLSAHSAEGLPPLLREITRGVRRAADRGSLTPPPQKPDFLLQLEQASPAERRFVLMEHLWNQSARVLGLDGSQMPHPQQPFQEMGLDSLMSVELKNVLAKILGHALPVTLLFDYPTLETLTDHLLSELFPATPTVLDETGLQADELAWLARLEQLSEAEAEALLAQRVNHGS